MESLSRSTVTCGISKSPPHKTYPSKELKHNLRLIKSLGRSTVNCSISKSPPHETSASNFMTASISSFKSVLKGLKEQLQLNIEVPRPIKTAAFNLLDDLVDSLFKFDEEPAFNKGNFAPVDEIGEAGEVSAIEGQIPEDFPEGIYLRTGPNHLYPHQTAAVSIFGRTVYVWVEGDGMLHATYFSKDDEGNFRISYKNKYVESETYLIEKRRNKKVFIPSADGDPCATLAAIILNMMRFGKAVKDDGNTNVFEHAGKVYAISEQHLPYEIDPSNLDTLGTWDVSGAWDKPFTSHPKQVPHTGEMVVLGCDIIKPHCVLGVISADGTKMLHKVDLKFETGTLLHEMGVTENYNIIMDYPQRFGLDRIIRGKSFMGYERDEGSKIGVMPRFGTAESISWFAVKDGCTLHIINSFENGDEVIVRGCRATGSVLPGPDHKTDRKKWYRRAFLQPKENSPSFDSAIDGVLFSRPYQWRLNMKTGEVREGFITGKEIAMDFPTINSRFIGLRNKYAYAQVVDSEASSKIGIPKYKMFAKLHFDLRDKDNEELIKVEYHELGEREFCSGLQFVQNPQGRDEDDGWLISYTHDEKLNTSKVHIIDAKRFTEEPVATITLPQRVPYGTTSHFKHPVHAVPSGTLWSLKREDFRGILVSKFSNLPSLKLLRSVEILSKLTILQLSRIAEALIEASFSDGQKIADENDCLSALYIIRKGRVRLAYRPELLSPDECCLLSSILDRGCHFQVRDEHVVEMSEGSHFGQWALLGEHIGSLTAISVGDVVCSVITKENFDSIVGPLTKILEDDCKFKSSEDSTEEECILNSDASACEKIQCSDLKWRTSIYLADSFDIGLVILKDSGNMRSLKRFSKKRIKEQGMEDQALKALKEKQMMKTLSPSAFVPKILCTCVDQCYLGILIDCCLLCSLGSVLRSPLDEHSAQFYAASVIVALEELHKNSILYRGVSPDILMLDRSGRLQLLDFRFSKKLSGERTFTICRNADYLAPEIILGRGHGFAADWWALGVLIYFMLRAEMPFGSWRESELETFAKIAKGQLALPQSFSAEVVDLMTELLQLEEAERLGSQGPDSIKGHPWFDGLDWKSISDGTFPIPVEVTSRVEAYADDRAEDTALPGSPQSKALADDLDTAEWLEDW